MRVLIFITFFAMSCGYTTKDSHDVEKTEEQCCEELPPMPIPPMPLPKQPKPEPEPNIDIDINIKCGNDEQCEKQEPCPYDECEPLPCEPKEPKCKRQRKCNSRENTNTNNNTNNNTND